MTAPPETAEWIAATAELARVIEAENDALARVDFSESCRFAETKRMAIMRLESMIDSRPVPAFGQDRPGSAALRQRLDAAIGRNRALLLQAIDTQQRVIATIVQALGPGEADTHYPSACGAHPMQRAAAPVALAVRA
ncbi:hypothetical protein AiwAL_07820 [Acidiphilium sp. AL]|uniref:Flagellar protein FlgN n=1 Tax=Acidiphilium iwatense TaxID=768198 RepID=A0ABS9DVB7_9PROT|nr:MULTISPECIES: hypothetical protein [Acidiphilium]MCF3946688.1 hypothetical protein [Acidiphilium iwatense]MCU4160013.1 hypothetical protein [Acidiphilium sp. AL]